LTDGAISGDDQAILDLVEAGVQLPMAPPAAAQAALQPDWVALRTIIEVFDGKVEITGAVSDPPWSSDPPGRVY
jgi:hypothetical protein